MAESEKYMETTTNTNALQTIVKEYATPCTTYALDLITAKGEKKHIDLTNDHALAFSALDEMERLGKRLDLGRCKLFAYIDREMNGSDTKNPRLGISTRDLIMQKYRYSKSTANSYLRVGKLCFKNDGSEKIARISEFTVAQVIPFLSILEDYPVVGGYDTDNRFFSWLIANSYISPEMGTDVIKGIADIWKSCHLPKEWFKEYRGGYLLDSTTTDGDYCNSILFPNCPYLEDATNTDETETETETESKTETETESKPVASMSGILAYAFNAIDTIPRTDEKKALWERFEALKNDLLALAHDLDKTETETETETESKSKSKSKK